MLNSRIWLAILTVVVASAAAFYVGRSFEQTHSAALEVQLRHTIDDTKAAADKATRESMDWQELAEKWKVMYGEISGDLKRADAQLATSQSKLSDSESEVRKQMTFVTPGLTDAVQSLLLRLHQADDEIAATDDNHWIAAEAPEADINHAAMGFISATTKLIQPLFKERRSHQK